MEPRKHTNPSALLMIVALALSAVLIGIGIYRVALTNGAEWTMLGTGCIGVVFTVLAWAVTLALAPHPADRSAAEARLDLIGDRLYRATEILTRISDQQLLSDRAKAVAFREKDRDALRKAILEEINRGDWDAAGRLADEMEVAFGYKAEATRFRDEIRARKHEIVRRQIQEVVDTIDRYTRTEQWSAATREADRLMLLFPEQEQVRNLPVEIDRRRQEFKRRLRESWKESVNRHDLDGSIEILKQLDTYLTPAEAAEMEESVRQVFKEKRDQLGKHFADAVTGHKWMEAIRVGETIISEFPESRMAQEVKEKMPVLRQRSTEIGAAAVLPAGV